MNFLCPSFFFLIFFASLLWIIPLGLSNYRNRGKISVVPSPLLSMTPKKFHDKLNNNCQHIKVSVRKWRKIRRKCSTKTAKMVFFFLIGAECHADKIWAAISEKSFDPVCCIKGFMIIESLMPVRIMQNCKSGASQYSSNPAAEWISTKAKLV